MEARRIDLKDYEYAGEGAVGQSYNLKADSRVMLKLYTKEGSAEGAKSELEFARKVYDAGIPTPKPGELVIDGEGRYGVQFERIVGKKSYSRATSDDFEHVAEYGREFGKLCSELHQIHIPAGTFPDVKEKYLSFLESNPFFTPEEKQKVAAFIGNIPESDIANHGDLQFSNAIRVEEGNEVKRYFIDLGDFAVGHPYTDLGQVLLCCMYETEEFSQEVFHLTCAQGAEFWKWFVKGYWGEDADPSEWQRKLAPYAGLKVLLIQHYFQSPFPAYKQLLMENI